MKKVLVILIGISLILGACSPKQKNTTPVANKTVTIAISGMSCTGCENTIQEAVKKVNGVIDVKATLADSAAVVSFDSTMTSIPVISDAINAEGYTAKGLK